MKTTVYLIRHAEAAGNINRIFQGSHDSEVSENGYAQLEKLAERCKDLPFDVMYSSPLKRAMETAKAANKYHNLKITTVDALKEIDGGDIEGKPFDQLMELFPEQWGLWETKPHLFTGVNGESMIDVYDRMVKTVLDIVKSNIGNTICIVSHGCAIRNFMCYAHQFDHCKLDDVTWCENTGISCIEFDEDCKPNVVFECNRDHLDDSLTTLLKQDWWKKK